jgi:hypothetical protein
MARTNYFSHDDDDDDDDAAAADDDDDDDEAKKKNMCVYGHPTHPIFQLPTLTFFIGNYSTLIFANNPINFYTEFG